MPAIHTLPPLPPQLIWSDIHIEHLLAATSNENRRVQNLVNVADVVMPPILNPESFSRYDGLYEAGHYHTTDTPADNKPQHFLQISGLS